MDKPLSMNTRKEITKRYAAEYRRASKKGKGEMLDQMVATIGWSRANARRALAKARTRKGPIGLPKRALRKPTYGYNTLKVLIHIWNLAGRPNGKYLAVTMDLWLPKLEQYGELDKKRFTPEVRAQLMGVSGATIDRMLAPTRKALELKGISTTKPGSLLRNSIAVRRAGDEHERAPGFVEADLVAHCGPTLVGEFVRTLTVTDVFTGWTENMAIRNSAHRWVVEAMTQIQARLPFALVGLDTDNGGEFINHALVNWADERDIYFTRSRPYTSNDNAHVEQKNGDVVRRHAFYYRYDPALELGLLNDLYLLVRVRLNMFTATKKAIGWRANKYGKNIRVYDKPATPYQRVLESEVMTKASEKELAELFDATNPAELTRQITRIQQELIRLAAAKNTALISDPALLKRAKIDEERTEISRAI